MIYVFHELWREADIHMDNMVKNQADFHKSNYSKIELKRNFSRIFPKIGN